MIGCPDCGALERIPPLAHRMKALCRICGAPLERRAGRSITAAAALSLTTLVLLLPATFAPLLGVRMLGVVRSSELTSGIGALWHNGWVVMALLLGAFGIVFPLIRFTGLTLALGTLLWSDRRPAWLGPLFRWMMRLDPWAMTDVFLIGFFIGYTRVSQHLTAIIGWGGWCFILAAFTTMLTRAALDRRTVWRAIAPERDIPPGVPVISCTVCDLALPADHEGGHCPRCGNALRARRPDAMIRAGALSLAALVLYVPANLYPMTVSSRFGQPTSHRIIDGVRELFQVGLWPFGILIFCTSIAIPLLKLLGMGWFMLSVRRGSDRHLQAKTLLYRRIDELGRWSNVDVFTIAIFVPLIRFDGLAHADAAIGAPCFALVVTLTMLASHAFDPRLMWDAANRERA